MNRIFEDVEKEYKSAREKFPPKGNLFGALIEEIGEVAQAFIENERGEGKKNSQDVYDELIQVMTMSYAILIEGTDEYPKFNPVEGNL